MKLKSNTILFITVLLSACTDENPATPDAVACFEYSPLTDIYTGDEISFTNCSQEATSFAWDFGDGNVSTDENPKHTYTASGDYTVKMVAANSTSADTTSHQISVNSNLVSYFSIDGTQYPLSSGRLEHTPWGGWNDNIHALWLVHNLEYSATDDWYVGTGNIIFFNFLVGAGPFDIVGNYSIGGHTDGLETEIRNMTNFSIYNGISPLAYDYNAVTGEPWQNDLDQNCTTCIKSDFSMSITENLGVYTINVSFTMDGKLVKIYYEGVLEKI
ncbi:MAG: PKD domain-containing protein [Cyclobacteriaceae bacterium]|nr:PKD domain-containing protein [Cyclobacteriaceae bacterium]